MRGIGDKAWNDSLAATIGAIGTADFARLLIEALKHVVPFNYSVIFAYCGSARPIDLHDSFPAAKRRIFVDDYQAGPYLLDPLFIARPEAWGPGPHRVADLAPDRFPQSQYFQSYYVQTGLSEEIAFFARINHKTRVVISLMRDAARLPAFATRERKRLASVAGLVAAASAQNWKDIEDRFSGSRRDREVEEAERILASAFHQFGEGKLTHREAEIAELVLKGNSSEAIGKKLGIATGTVRIHRKNIYLKLGISSQGELFSRFVASIPRALPPTGARDGN
ncbi:helix-turn-helix transcriptional regulator [Taklimakanibacter lacteus]|uniref:helix-turn-helix transcriptional regulator n=1 Tax=Taklimakanibacter lacteus TaxID=2268456 RepID=UPI000E6755D7